MSKWIINSILSEEGRTLIKVELKQPIEPINILEIGEEVERRVKGLRNMDIVVLSGKAPIWLYSYLTHKLSHLVKILAIFDPKLNRAVVVSSHSKISMEGELIKLTKDEIEHLL